jgi:uncharacterized protein YqgV (UPF0045/DUF77 family)
MGLRLVISWGLAWEIGAHETLVEGQSWKQ